VIVAANLSTVPFQSYNIGLPRAGTWYLRFNSDWSGYSGDFTDVGYDTLRAMPPGRGVCGCARRP
jgi:hypothetical protein